MEAALINKSYKIMERAFTVICALCVIFIAAFATESSASAVTTLFGVAFVSTNNQLVSINSATGGVTSVSNSLGVVGINQGISALDTVNHVYFFEGPGNRLYEIDTQSG